MCLARNVSNITGVIGGTLENYFMNPEAWNLQGYTGFVWGACAWIVFVWAYFRLPETKVRRIYTFAELNPLTLFTRIVLSMNWISCLPNKFRLESLPVPTWMSLMNISKTNWLCAILSAANHLNGQVSFHQLQTRWRPTDMQKTLLPNAGRVSLAHRHKHVVPLSPNR